MATQNLALTKDEIELLYFPEKLYNVVTETDQNTKISLKDFKDKIVEICEEFVNQLNMGFKIEKDYDINKKGYEIGVYFSNSEIKKIKYFIGLAPYAAVKGNMSEYFIFQIDFGVNYDLKKDTDLNFLDLGICTYNDTADKKFWYCKSLDIKLLIDLDNVKKKKKFFKKAKKSLKKLFELKALNY